MSNPIRPLHRGFVSLVGAGPGDPELLTLRGLRALQQAEVILTDALVDPTFEALFPSQAEVVPVGKRCGDHLLAQEGINALLIAQAQAGRRVVRLKGGDPFVYGRGGEEALALVAAGIPFEVIPGISALNGVSASAGIPLTHRGLSKEVRVLEGHSPRSDAEWTNLAAYRGTLALFMGTRDLAATATALIRHGADPAWPLALVEGGCTPHQVVQVGCLQDAAALRMCPRTPKPGLVLMGPTVPLHALLQPLSGDAHVPSALHTPSRLPQPRGSARPAGGRRERRVG